MCKEVQVGWKNGLLSDMSRVVQLIIIVDKLRYNDAYTELCLFRQHPLIQTLTSLHIRLSLSCCVLDLPILHALARLPYPHRILGDAMQAGSLLLVPSKQSILMSNCPIRPKAVWYRRKAAFGASFTLFPLASPSLLDLWSKEILSAMRWAILYFLFLLGYRETRVVQNATGSCLAQLEVVLVNDSLGGR